VFFPCSYICTCAARFLLYFRTFSLLVGRERVEEEEEGEEEESRASSCLYIVCCFSCPSLPDACAPVARERETFLPY